MSPDQARVLLIGVDDDQAVGIRQALEGGGCDVEHVANLETALARLQNQRVDMVVSGWPLPSGQLGSMLMILRGRTRPNRHAALVLVTPPESIRAASSLLGRGVTRVVSSTDDPDVLLVLLERVLADSSRLDRVAARLPVAAGSPPHHWQTADLSESGMLVAAEPPPVLGGRLPFTLDLPEGPISGRMVVTRHTVAGHDPVHGFGARIVELEDDGRERLIDFLRAQQE